MDWEADDEGSGLLFLTALGGKPLGRAKLAPMRHVVATGLDAGHVLIVPHATLCTEFAPPPPAASGANLARAAVSAEPAGDGRGRIGQASEFVLHDLAAVTWGRLHEHFLIWKMVAPFLYIENFSHCSFELSRLLTRTCKHQGRAAVETEEAELARELVDAGLAEPVQQGCAEIVVFKICFAKIRYGWELAHKSPALSPRLGLKLSECTQFELLGLLICQKGFRCEAWPSRNNPPPRPYRQGGDKLIYSRAGGSAPMLEYLLALALSEEILTGEACIPHGATAEQYQALVAREVDGHRIFESMLAQWHEKNRRQAIEADEQAVGQLLVAQPRAGTRKRAASQAAGDPARSKDSGRMTQGQNPKDLREALPRAHLQKHNLSQK